jgi:hypothetical protein
MRLDRGGQAVGGLVVEHVDHSAAGHVDQHGPVGVAAPPGEVIDARHRQRRSRWLGQCADQPQQRHPAHERPEPASQPGAGPPAQRQSDRLYPLPRQRAEPAMAHRHPVDLLGKDPAYAAAQCAEEPPHPQVQHGLPPTDRRVQ